LVSNIVAIQTSSVLIAKLNIHCHTFHTKI